MKKNLLFILCIAIAICTLFAISASAVSTTGSIDYDETATLSDGTILPIYDKNHNSLIWFILKTETIDNGDGTTTTKNTYASVPANRNSSDNATSYVTFNINSTYGTNQLHDTYIKYWDPETSSYVSYGEGTVVIYNLRSLTREYWSVGTWASSSNLEYVYHSATARDAGSYRGYTKLQLIDCSLSTNYTGFAKQAFNGCTALRTVRLASSGSYSLSTTEGNLFRGCTALTEITIPDCVTGIGSSTFSGCSNLEKVYIGKGSQITYMESTAFAGCSSLEGLYLPPLLEALSTNTGGDKGTFYGCSSLYFINEPDETTKPSVYYFPASLQLSNVWNFRECNSLNETLVLGTAITAVSENTVRAGISVKNVVCLGQITALNRENLNNSTYPLTYYLSNKSQTSLDGVTLSNSGRYSVVVCNAQENETHLASPKNSNIIPATCYSNQKGIVRCFCDTKISDGEVEGTMLDTHDYVDDFNCTTANLCKNFGEGKCNKFLAAEYETHAENHDVIYADGFTSAGVHNIYCSNTNCKALDKVENLGAMFTHEGYSYKSRTYGGIDTKFRINTDAMKLYEQYEGVLHFGIVIANANHFANVDAFIEDGKLTSTNAEGKKTGIIVEMTSREYEYFNCYIDGFKLDDPDHIALGLIIAGYVYGEDESDITYIQKDYKTDSDNATLETPYIATIAKDKEIKIVNIVAVKNFEPLKENQQ